MAWSVPRGLTVCLVITDPNRAPVDGQTVTVAIEALLQVHCPGTKFISHALQNSSARAIDELVSAVEAELGMYASPAS
jgi:hypothetical protein